MQSRNVKYNSDGFIVATAWDVNSRTLTSYDKVSPDGSLLTGRVELSNFYFKQGIVIAKYLIHRNKNYSAPVEVDTFARLCETLNTLESKTYEKGGNIYIPFTLTNDGDHPKGVFKVEIVHHDQKDWIEGFKENQDPTKTFDLDATRDIEFFLLDSNSQSTCRILLQHDAPIPMIGVEVDETIGSTPCHVKVNSATQVEVGIPATEHIIWSDKITHCWYRYI